MSKKRINIIGQKFNRFTVIEFSHTDKWGSTCWLCKCDCGNEKIIRGTHVTDGRIKSCGCLAKEVAENGKLPKGVAIRNKILSVHKTNAKKRNIEHSLTDEQIMTLHKGNCHYCGVPPSNTLSVRDYNGAYTYSGIDRVDNDKGYTITNTVSCCKYCNTAKGTMSIEDFTQWINNLINYNL
ncbi:hypothetical protein LCGC14_0278440 [marine sediment metagenome]|uniref:HNH domain-containing protein n=1 Tax=marine sediment metagenome TaxID=412755 RepID=A0A0F9WHV4_9ZZZZ